VRRKLRAQGPFAAISLSNERRSLLKELQHVCSKLNRRLCPGVGIDRGVLHWREINCGAVLAGKYCGQVLPGIIGLLTQGYIYN